MVSDQYVSGLIASGWFSAALVVASCGMMLRFGIPGYLRMLSGVLLAMSIILWALFVALQGVSANGFDEMVVYHLSTGLKGAGIAGYEYYVVKWVFILLGLLCLSIYCFIKTPTASVSGNVRYGAVIFLCGAIIANPLVAQIKNQLPLLKTVFHPSLYMAQTDIGLGGLEGFYAEATTENLSDLDKNIVIVYLESLESAYFDEDIFGDLLPNLKAMSPQAIRFENVAMGPFTWWTMGGIVGSQCGVPLVPFGDAQVNDFTGFDRFLVGATCFGDLLRSRGYFSEYIGGASLAFAGKGDYLRTHGYNSMWGREELASVLSSQAPVNSWGYFDDEVLAFSKERFSALYKAGKPFSLTILTLDTHPPKGFVSPLCERSGVTLGDNSMKDAIRCADFLISDFVNDIRTADTRKNTLVILITDHVSHPNAVYSDIEKSGERRLVFWAFSPDREGGAIERDDASTFDVAATVLSLAGGDVDGHGFGRNLLSENLTASPDWSTFIDHRPLADFLWRTSGIETDIVVMPEQQGLFIGRQRMKLPLVINFRDDDTIESVLWPKPDDLLINRFKPANALMINDCDWLSSDLSGELCIFYRSQSGVLYTEKVTGRKVINREVLQGFLEDRTLAEPGSFTNLGYVISTGGPGRFSGVYQNGELKPFTRGINIFRIDSSGLDMLASFDLCGDADGSLTNTRLRNLLDNTDKRVYLAVKDSAVCGDHDFAALLDAINVQGLANLGFREPYIAVIDGNNNVVLEQSGDTETRIVYPLLSLDNLGEENAGSDSLPSG